MKFTKILGIGAIVGLLIVAVVGTQVLASTNMPSWPWNNNNGPVATNPEGRGYGHGYGPGNGTGPIVTQPAGDLSDEEAEGLLYMREEEKLARDVYLTLGEKWDVQVFENIARSEQMHMDAIATLLERYDLDDPAAGKDVGEFTNPELQTLYEQLVAQGSASLADALKVGGAIEEIDILDLKDYIAKTDNADIQEVYEHLMAGSENHLRAFVRTLEATTGETYQPQYLDEATYNAIINGTGGPGAGHGWDYGQGRGRGHGRGHGPHGSMNGACLEVDGQ